MQILEAGSLGQSYSPSNLPKRSREAYAADQATEKGSRAKLGSLSYASVARGGRTITIVNGTTQFDFRGRVMMADYASAHPRMRADYDAVRSVMRQVKARFSGRTIGYPRIGAGLAGGDWSVIAPIIEEELAGEDHTLVEYAG